MSDQPITIVEKNSAERIQVALAEYENRPYLDVRLYFLPRDGDQWRPTKKGITLAPRKIPDLNAALQKAEAAARAAGLLGDTPATSGRSTSQQYRGEPDRARQGGQIDPVDALSAG